MANIKFSEFSETQEVADIPFLVGYGVDNKKIPTAALLSASKGLIGTQYVFVQANGTDIENAIELQAAYDLAITKIQTTQALSAPYDYPYQQTPTMLEFFDFSGTLPILIQGQSYTFNVEGVDMIGEVITESGGSMYEVEFPTAFTYNEGDVRVYTLETVRSIVIAAPGIYNFENGNFIMDTEYVDLVSLDGNSSIVFNGVNTIEISANNIFVKGVDVLKKNFFVFGNLNKLILEKCKGGDLSFSGSGGNLTGKFIDCEGGSSAFAESGTASGTFINCIAKSSSFGANGVASGIFINCTGSFASNGVASGIFTNCTGEGGAFGGGPNGTANGSFINCRVQSGTGSFGGGSGSSTASGIFTNCTGNVYSFGGNGTASGTFINCIGDTYSFGGHAGTASGLFSYCMSGDKSFGGRNWSNAITGTLSGKLYYCRLTSGTFITKSGAGRVVLCIDGNSNQNNQ